MSVLINKKINKSVIWQLQLTLSMTRKKC